MDELQQELNKLNERYSYLNKKLKHYKALQYRSMCPYCNQETDRDYFLSKIPGIESEMQKIDAKWEEMMPIVLEREKEQARIKEKDYREKQARIADYLTLNKNKLNKAIREYNKGAENYLPNIPDTEKPMWNEAMEIHLDNRNMDENDELCYDM